MVALYMSPWTQFVKQALKLNDRARLRAGCADINDRRGCDAEAADISAGRAAQPALRAAIRIVRPRLCPNQLLECKPVLLPIRHIFPAFQVAIVGALLLADSSRLHAHQGSPMVPRLGCAASRTATRIDVTALGITMKINRHMAGSG